MATAVWSSGRETKDTGDIQDLSYLYVENRGGSVYAIATVAATTPCGRSWTGSWRMPYKEILNFHKDLTKVVEQASKHPDNQPPVTISPDDLDYNYYTMGG